MLLLQQSPSLFKAKKSSSTSDGVRLLHSVGLFLIYLKEILFRMIESEILMFVTL